MLLYSEKITTKQNLAFGCPLEERFRCVAVRTKSEYVGEGNPHVAFFLTRQGDEEPVFESHSYIFGGEQFFRVPPAWFENVRLRVEITLPEGGELKLFELSADYGDPAPDWTGGLRFNAHLGFWGMAPNNTMPAFELAALCGFPACIVVPKLTAGGELVCIHDDTLARYARDAEGNSPPDERKIWDMTLEELDRWDYGLYKHPAWRGTGIPRLADFFDLCAKTGMRPMFSTHPGLPVEKWREVREMLEKRGLLSRFHIKSFDLDVLETAWSVFGTDIDGYTYDNRKWEPERLAAYIACPIDFTACRCGMEVRFDHYTPEIAQEILDAGLFAAAWSIKRRTEEEYRRIISWGITEFTEDYHCTPEMNW